MPSRHVLESYFSESCLFKEKPSRYAFAETGFMSLLRLCGDISLKHAINKCIREMPLGHPYNFSLFFHANFLVMFV
jgi:hypothetical protein